MTTRRRPYGPPTRERYERGERLRGALNAILNAAAQEGVADTSLEGAIRYQPLGPVGPGYGAVEPLPMPTPAPVAAPVAMPPMDAGGPMPAPAPSPGGALSLPTAAPMPVAKPTLSQMDPGGLVEAGYDPALADAGRDRGWGTWRWPDFSFGNPFSGERWGRSIQDTLHNLEILDRHIWRPMRQPFIEGLPAASSMPGTINVGIGPNGEVISPATEAMDARRQQLSNIYDQYEDVTGLPPGYWERGDIQQATTPVGLDIAAGFVADPTMLIPPLGVAQQGFRGVRAGANLGGDLAAGALPLRTAGGLHLPPPTGWTAPQYGSPIGPRLVAPGVGETPPMRTLAEFQAAQPGMSDALGQMRARLQQPTEPSGLWTPPIESPPPAAAPVEPLPGPGPATPAAATPPSTMGQQSGLGDDFATNANLGMDMGEGRATAAPLADEGQLRAAEQRRQQLAAGQSQMGGMEAPPQAAAAPVRRIEGNPAQAVIDDDEYDFTIAVMELDDPRLLASHNPGNFAPTPGYPQELQPRDRSSREMQENIAKIQGRFNPNRLLREHHDVRTGVPIVADEGGNVVVESGNGRIITLRQSPENYERYRQTIPEMSQKYGYGITPEQLAQFNKPVLVRVRQTPLTPDERIDFVRRANSRETAAMNITEVAGSDVRLLGDDLMARFEEPIGMSLEDWLETVDGRQFFDDFVERLPPEEQVQMRIGGRPSQDGYRRLNAALMAKTLGPEGKTVIDKFLGTAGEDMGRLQGGVTRAMPDLITLNARIERGASPAELSISSDLIRAMQVIEQLKNDGRRGSLMDKALDWLNTNTLGSERTLGSDVLVKIMAASTRSSQPLVRFLDHYVEQVIVLGDIRLRSSGDADPLGLGAVAAFREIPGKTELLEEAAQMATTGNNRVGVDVSDILESAAWRVDSPQARMQGQQGQPPSPNPPSPPDVGPAATVPPPTPEAPQSYDRIIRLANRAANIEGRTVGNRRAELDGLRSQLRGELEQFSDEDLRRLSHVPSVGNVGTANVATGAGARNAVAARILNEEASAVRAARGAPTPEAPVAREGFTFNLSESDVMQPGFQLPSSLFQRPDGRTKSVTMLGNEGLVINLDANHYVELVPGSTGGRTGSGYTRLVWDNGLGGRIQSKPLLSVNTAGALARCAARGHGAVPSDTGQRRLARGR